MDSHRSQEVSTVLIIGETHPESIFKEALKVNDESESEVHIVLMQAVFNSEKHELSNFKPNKIFLETRRHIRIYGHWYHSFVNSRLPTGMKGTCIEGDESRALGHAVRENKMGERVATFVRRHPSEKVTLICGTKHARGVAKRIIKRTDGKLQVKIIIKIAKLSGLRVYMVPGPSVR